MADQGHLFNGAPMNVTGILPISQFVPPPVNQPQDRLEDLAPVAEDTVDLDDVIDLHPDESDDVEEPYDVISAVAAWTRPYD